MANNISAILAAIASEYDILGDVFRAAAFARAASILAEQPRTAASLESTHVRGIGLGIIAIIREIEATGQSSLLADLRAGNSARRVLTGILGVGPSTADRLIAAGYTSIEALRAAGDAAKLTKLQRIGLTYYEDLQERIPRAEVTEIGSRVFRAVAPAKMEICGSYRRGAETSGDIDILVTGTTIKNILSRIADKIVISAGPAKAMILMKGRKMRQVDIIVARPSEYAAAIVYFTGSWEFNERVRRLAKQRGLRLNQTGLYKKSGGRLIHIRTDTEEDIFGKLGLEYVRPSERV